MPSERELLDWNTSEIIRETIWAEIKGREQWEDTQGPKYNYKNPHDLRGKPLPTKRSSQQPVKAQQSHAAPAALNWWDCKQGDSSSSDAYEATVKKTWCPLRHREVYQSTRR